VQYLWSQRACIPPHQPQHNSVFFFRSECQHHEPFHQLLYPSVDAEAMELVHFLVLKDNILLLLKSHLLTYCHYSPTSVAWSPDGTKLAIGMERLLDCKAGISTLMLWSMGSDGTFQQQHLKDKFQQRGVKCQPMLKSLTGQTGGITSVAWSLDGKKIASASSDTRLDRQTISIFDSQSGICNLILEGHTNTVRNVGFHPKNPHLLASCSDDGSIKIWNLSTGLCDTTLMGHSEGNHECKCKRGSRQFQNPDWQDFQVNPEWQDFQVNPECTVTGHSHRVLCVAWSPDGTKLASGSRDNTVKIWSVGLDGTFTCENTMRGHTKDNKNCVCKYQEHDISRDGHHDRQSFYHTNADCPVLGHSLEVNSVVWRPNSTELFSGSKDGTIRVWDSEYEKMCKSPLTKCNGKTKSDNQTEQTTGKHVVTAKDNVMLVHKVDEVQDMDETVPVAFFRAPSAICSFLCTGDKITVDCINGDELLLRAPFLVEI